MRKTAMPEEVWVLTADDFCKGRDTTNDGKRCCTGRWIRTIFPNHCDEVRTAFCKELDVRWVHKWNDKPGRSFSTLARFFNWMMAHKFGYTEGNPEAKRAKP